MTDLICAVSITPVQDIVKGIEQNGRSLALKKILEEKRSGGCDVFLILVVLSEPEQRPPKPGSISFKSMMKRNA